MKMKTTLRLANSYFLELRQLTVKCGLERCAKANSFSSNLFRPANVDRVLHTIRHHQTQSSSGRKSLLTVGRGWL
jgi:hypothetical protein